MVTVQSVLWSISLLAATASPKHAVNPRAIEALRQEAYANETDALLIIHQNEIVLEEYPTGERLIDVMSATKSITALAVELLIQQGKISSIDVPVYTYYPEWNQGQKKQITLRHILNHTSCVQDDQASMPEELIPSPNLLKLALAAELECEPGTVWDYNNKAVNILAGIVSKVSGKSLETLVAEELFAPLGITDFKWKHDADGNPWAMAGIKMHARDLAKVGQLMLDLGEWRGNALLHPDRVEEMLAASQEHVSVCGLLWWRTPFNDEPDAPLVAFSARGFLGQWLVVLPEERTIAVRLHEERPPDADAWVGVSMFDFEDLVRQL